MTANRLSFRAELVTLTLSLWLIAGVFVDGWAHVNLNQLDTFFTPWHALFYSGFAAVAAWISFLVMRAQDRGVRGRAAIPAGYGLGVVGLGVFALGGAGDLVWHTLFGIEQDLAALLSPTHILLIVGMMLIVSSPLRAAFGSPGDHDARRLRSFLPPLLSLTLLVAITSFFVMYLVALADRIPTLTAAGWQGQSPYPGDEILQELGIAKVLVTNAILVAAVLYLLRRWQPPFGSVTILFTTVAVFMSGLFAFEQTWSIIPAAVGGVGADLLIRWLRPSPDRPGSFRLAGLALPLMLWAAHFLTLGIQAPLAWSPELWSGTMLMTALSGLALTQLMLPTPMPARAVEAVASPRSSARGDERGDARRDARPDLEPAYASGATHHLR